MRHQERHVGRTYAVFTALFAVVFLFAYSFTPLGDEIENRLFDLRTRLKPRGVPVDGVRILTFTAKSLEQLKGENPERISLKSLEDITRTALRRGYRSVNIVLTTNPYSLGVDEMETLVRLGKEDGRVRLGVLDVDSDNPAPRELPLMLRPLDVRVFSADTFKRRTTDIVRLLPQSAYRGLSLRESFPAAIGEYLEATVLPQKQLYINYIEPSELLKTDALSFLEHGVGDSDPTSEDLLFAYGQMDNRRRFARYAYVNTPWNHEGDDLLGGVYLPDFIAISALNFQHQSFLSRASWWVEGLQTVLLSLVFGLIWAAGSSWAFVVILGAWTGVLLLHGFLFTHAYVFIPFGQSTLVAIVAGIIGGQWRLKVETQLRIAQETETKTKRDFVERQTLSLSRYAEGLMQLNDAIRKDMGELVREMQDAVATQEPLRLLFVSADELREYLQGIVQVAGVSRAGKFPVLFAPVYVRALLERVIAQFESRREEKNLGFSLDIKPDFVIPADEKILENVIFNFVSNAVRFSPEGGKIRIVAGRRSARKAFVRVEDEGPGIPPGQEDFIFEKFYQIAGEQQSELKGHGLGLYLSRFFASVLKGSIRVVPHDGKGAWFEIELPLRGGRS